MFELNINNQIDSRQKNLDGLLLMDCNWAVKTAGPSPYDNNRTELFLLGCRKAKQGNPCKGCFNSITWDNSKAQWSHDIKLMAQHINNNAPNKYITIGGGEPTDQIDNLILLCEELKKYDFHIMVYTWREINKAINNDCQGIFIENIKEKFLKLIHTVDIIVDGEYKQEERLWNGSKEDGFISSIGSGNQMIYDTHKKQGYFMKDIKSLSLNKKNELEFQF